MSTNALKILIVQEQQSDIKLIESILKDSDIDFEAKYAKTENEFLKYINRFHPEVIISGHNFTKFSLEEQLEYLSKENLMIPFILMAGSIPDEILHEYLKKGVDEYITRYNLLQLPNLILKAIEAKQLRKNKEEVEETLRQKENRLNRFFENIPESIFELGFGCEIILMNPLAEELLNFRSKLKLRKLKFSDLIHKADLKAFKEFHASICRGQKKELLFRIHNGRDETIWLSCKGIPMYNEEEEIISALLIARNITEEKNTTEKLLLSNATFDAVLESVQEAIWSIDKEQKITYFNKQAEKFFHTHFKIRLRKEMSVQQLHTVPNSMDAWKNRYQSVLSGNTFIEEDHLIHGGSEKAFSVEFYPITNANGISGASIVCREITESKKIQKETKVSNDTLKLITENAPVCMFHCDTAGSCTYVNERWTQLTGLSVADSLGYGWAKAIHPDDRERVYEYWRITVELGVEFNMDYRFVKDDKTFWITTRAVAVKNEKNEITGFIGAVTDISHLKSTSNEVLEKQILLEELGKNPYLSFSSFDVEPPYKSTSSENTYRIFELPMNQEINYAKILDRIHPMDKEKVEKAWNEARQLGKGCKLEYRLKLPGGRLKYLTTNVFTIRDSKGTVTKVLGATIDRTKERLELKRMEEQQLFLQDTYALANIGSWEVDLESGKMFWSDEVKQLFGTDKTESAIGLDQFREMVHPDDLDRYLAFEEKQISSGKSDMIKLRLIYKNKLNHFVLSSHPMRDEFNTVSTLTGLIMNVTENVQEEEKKESVEEMFHSIFENSPDAIYIEDENGYILDANEKACSFQKLNKDELVGKNVLDITPAKYKERVWNDFKKLFNGEVQEFQSLTWTNEGKEIPVEIHVSNIQYGTVNAVMLIVRDISKWVKDEKVQTSKTMNDR